MTHTIRTKLFLVLILVLIYSCNETKKKENRSENMKVQKSYLALGDSYTIGESVAEKDRWPVQLAKALNKKGHPISAPKIIAKTGWTTDELKAAIEEKELKGTFDLVSLSIGVNNQYRGMEAVSYREELAELLQTAINFAGDKTENVFVLSIPDWGKTPFAKDRDKNKIEQEIALFNKIKMEECNKVKVAFVEITNLTQNLNNDSTLLAKDGLHYSGKMHKLWVDEVIKQLFDN